MEIVCRSKSLSEAISKPQCRKNAMMTAKGRDLLYAINWLDDAKVLDYLNSGGDPNIRLQGRSLLYCALRAGLNQATARLILEKGADVNRKEEGVALLIEALYRRYFDLVEILLEHGVDINATDANGVTPFMVAAAMAWDFEMPTFLLRRGADPYKRAPSGISACDIAWLNGHRDFEKHLKAFLKESSVGTTKRNRGR
jgi:uncharacterized protein